MKLRLTLYLTAVLPALLVPAGRSACQQYYAPESERMQNEADNIRYGSAGATRLAGNSLRDWGSGTLDYTHMAGGFKAVNMPDRTGTLSVGLGGLKNLGKVDVAGYLVYDNITEDGRNWNSSLGLDPANPFFTADSTAGKSSTERFRMAAELSWKATSRLTLGASVKLTTAQLSDNTDPRPKVNHSRIPVCLAADFGFTEKWRGGVFAGAELLNETLGYTVVSTGKNHQYFVMKGLGDYYRMSSLTESGYNRECLGKSFFAGVNLLSEGGAVENFFEASVRTNSENAASEQAKWHAGDFSALTFCASDRLRIGSGRVRHNLIVDAAYKTGEGWWYEQKKLTDTEHGSVIYYEILSKDKIHRSTDIDAGLRYRLDAGRGSFTSELRYGSGSVVHYNDSGAHSRQIDRLSFSAEGTRGGMKLGLFELRATGGAKAVLPLAPAAFDGACNYTGSADIDPVYTEPLYNYDTTGYWGLCARLDASVALDFRGTAAKVGLFAAGASDFAFGGRGSRATLRAGLFINTR